MKASSRLKSSTSISDRISRSSLRAMALNIFDLLFPDEDRQTAARAAGGFDEGVFQVEIKHFYLRSDFAQFLEGHGSKHFRPPLPRRRSADCGAGRGCIR